MADLPLIVTIFIPSGQVFSRVLALTLSMQKFKLYNLQKQYNMMFKAYMLEYETFDTIHISMTNNLKIQNQRTMLL